MGVFSSCKTRGYIVEISWHWVLCAGLHCLDPQAPWLGKSDSGKYHCILMLFLFTCLGNWLAPTHAHPFARWQQSSKETVTVLIVYTSLTLGSISVCILLYNECKTCDSHYSRILWGSAWFWSLFSGHHSHLLRSLLKTEVLHRRLHVHMTQHIYSNFR